MEFLFASSVLPHKNDGKVRQIAWKTYALFVKQHFVSPSLCFFAEDFVLSFFVRELHLISLAITLL
jgi:hypothetical protein